MATLAEMPSYMQILLFTLPISLLLYPWIYYQLCLPRKPSSLPTNWPVIGMIPAIFRHAHRLHDYGTDVLIESGGTVEFKGPWFANLDMVITSDPANIHHILSKNFSNYPKGPEFRKIFDIIGDGLLNTDGELSEIHRKVTVSMMHNADFRQLMQEALLKKLENGLHPILENCVKRVSQVDMQDILQRFTFDMSSILLLDHDPDTLSVDLPYVPAEYAFTDAGKAILHRHVLPESWWKLQKWLGFGNELKLSNAWIALDQYIYPCIDKKKKLFTDNNLGIRQDRFDGLTALIQAYKGISFSSTPNYPNVNKKFIRDATNSLLIAGRDTISTALTWFFFLLDKNPSVEEKILREIRSKEMQSQPIVCNSANQAGELVYLHGALSETLRLFPPVPFEHKAPAKADILPSGVKINANAKVLLLFYTMGRMESIWGKDCLEFRPERWINEQGRIKREPAYNFPAFNAGPRKCLGREIAFVQMKMIAAFIVHNYHVQVVKDHPVTPTDSIILQMKHGLKVKLYKRI